MAAAVAELRPGVSERELTGVFMDAMASQGVTTPATQDVVRITTAGPARPRRGRRRCRRATSWPSTPASSPTATPARSAAPGRSASTAPGAGVAGLYRRWDELWARLLDACQPGRRRQRAVRRLPGGR